MEDTNMLNVTQRELVKELAEKYGEDITLKQLLEIKEEIPIEDVEFDIRYVITDGTECAGDEIEYKGTIKKILSGCLTWTLFKGYDNKPHTETDKIKNLFTEAEIDRLSRFIACGEVGNRQRLSRFNASREVTLEEVKEYISNLDVRAEEDYEGEYTDLVNSFIEEEE